MIWLVFALVTMAVAGAVLWPLLRPPAQGAIRARHDIAVYREQLAEIDVESARGTMSEGDAEAARREIERRLLRAGDELGQESGTRKTSGVVAGVVVALAIPAGATALYLKLGQPNLPAQPLATRDLGQNELAQARQAGNLAEMAARLSQRLESNPKDGEGWFLLGRTYFQMERFDEAAQAYAKAAEFAPSDPNSRMALAEAQVYSAQGVVTPDAVANFDRLLELEPKHPGARYYLALARAQAGDDRAAFEGWKALALDSAPDAPWQQVLQARLRETAQKLRIDLAQELPKLPKPAEDTAPKGPTAEDMKAAASMSAEDRQAMIRGMVERLASRLEENPNDAEGWDRLARAYDVLGEADKASDARSRGEAVRRLTGGLAATTPPAAPLPQTPRGPTPDQVKAASQMSAEDRQAMIRGMVDGLAERLKSSPNDIEGWTRLARSYEVLQEPAKAKEAWEKVKLLEGGEKLEAQAPKGSQSTKLSAAEHGEMTKLVGQLEARLQSQPDDAEGWTRLGQARILLGQPKKAREAFAEAIRLKPKDVDILLDQAGAILDDEGSSGPIPAAADEIYRQVLALSPENPDALWYVGVAEMQAGRGRVALTYWEKLLAKLDPNSVEAAQVREAVNAAKRR